MLADNLFEIIAFQDDNIVALWLNGNNLNERNEIRFIE